MHKYARPRDRAAMVGRFEVGQHQPEVAWAMGAWLTIFEKWSRRYGAERPHRGVLNRTAGISLHVAIDATCGVGLAGVGPNGRGDAASVLLPANYPTLPRTRRRHQNTSFAFGLAFGWYAG